MRYTVAGNGKHVNPLSSQMADFVAARTQWIIESWLRVVDGQPRIDSSSDNLTRAQLVDHLPALCADLSERLRNASRADVPEEHHHAQEHGSHRWDQGYRLEELIREAAIVRRIVAIDLLKDFARENPKFDDASHGEARRVIEDFFTEMLVESAKQFAQEKQNAVTASEEHSQAILDSALDCVIVMDGEGLVREWNPAAEAVFGYTRGEALGKELAKLIIPAELRDRHRRGLAHFLATGEGPLLGHRIEVSALRADGSCLMVELSIASYQVNGNWGFTAYLRDITARRFNEEASQRLAALVQSSADAIIAHELDGIITNWNEGAERLYGYSAPEVIGKSITLLIPPERRAEERDILSRVRRGELVAQVETLRQRKDGRLLEVSLTVSPIRDKDNNVVGASKIARDITQAKRAERASQLLLAVNDDIARLRNPEEMMRSAGGRIGEFFIASHCAFVEFDREANIATVVSDWRRDRGARDYVGVYRLADYMTDDLSRALVAGLPVIVNDVAGDARTSHALEKHRALEIGSFLNTPFLSGGGLQAAVAVYRREAHQWREDEVNLLRELTARVWTRIERARSEQALRETSQRFQTLADNIKPLAWMANPDGSIFFYNKRWFDYTGTTLQEMQGWGWGKVHHPDHIERVTKKWNRHLQLGEPWEDTFPLCGKDGQYRWFLSSASPIRDAEGKIVRWFGSNTDIDDQKRTEEALRVAQHEAEAANQAKDRFLAALSHELRTPLNPVLMWACAALEEPNVDTELREGLRMICRNIQLEARLIDDLLDLTRISRGKLQLKRHLCDAHELLQHTVEIVRSQITGKDLRLSLDLSAGSHVVNADSARLEQVFWNILKNASKFTPAAGEISVRSYNATPGVLAFEISDTGPGIDEKLLPKLFTAFEQAHPTGEGLGLGLAISKGIVDIHGGKLSARNKEQGHGAIFTLELSAVAGDLASEPVSQSSSGAPLRRLRILVVEDHAETATTMRKLLERAGHETVVATTVREALEILRAERLDVLVSDLGLPDGNGLQVMRELSKVSNAKGIAISGYGMDEDLRRSREAGFSAHLTKPINAQELTRAVREVAEIRR